MPSPLVKGRSSCWSNAVLFVGSVLALGCGDGTGWPIRAVRSSSGGATGDTTNVGGASNGGDTSGGSTGTPGCNGNATPPTSPSDGYLTIDVNGTSRQYVLELGAGYDGKTPQPVLFSLHGTGTTALEFLGAYYGNVRAGVAGRAVVVGPQALSGNGKTAWVGSGGVEQTDNDFFDALVAELKANYCVDPGRVFAMGHGAGAYFANELGCARSSVVRSVGPFTGDRPYGNCSGKAAAFIGHNPNDTSTWAAMGWPTVQFWTKQNGCNDPGAMPTAPYPGDGTTGNPLPCQTCAGCDPNYPVTLCLYDYWDQWDENGAFPLQWGGKAAMDFFLALPQLPQLLSV